MVAHATFEHSGEQMRTMADVVRISGKSKDAVRMEYKRTFEGRMFGSDALLLPDERAHFENKYGYGVGKAQTASTQTASPRPIIVQVQKPMPTAKPKQEQIEQPKKQTLINKVAQFVGENDFLFIVVAIGFFAQLTHTRRFVQTCLLSGDVEAILPAIAIDLTAFEVTIRTGKQGYLVAALFAHFAMNITYYIMTDRLNFGSALLSILLALSVFAYAELYTKIIKVK